MDYGLHFIHKQTIITVSIVNPTVQGRYCQSKSNKFQAQVVKTSMNQSKDSLNKINTVQWNKEKCEAGNERLYMAGWDMLSPQKNKQKCSKTVNYTFWSDFSCKFQLTVLV